MSTTPTHAAALTITITNKDTSRLLDALGFRLISSDAELLETLWMNALMAAWKARP